MRLALDLRPSPPPPDRTRWLAVLAVAVTVFMAGLDITIVAVALPDFGADLAVSPGAAPLAVLAYLLPVIGLMLRHGPGRHLLSPGLSCPCSIGW